MDKCTIGHYCNCKYNQDGYCTHEIKPEKPEKEEVCENYHE